MLNRSDPFAELCARLADGAAFAASWQRPFRRALRRHPRRGSLSGWGALSAVPWSPAGSWHGAEIDPATRLDYHSGLAYPQDAASQLPVEVLAPQPGEVVVDCCAAPGSKSGQIGLALGDAGLLICCDAAPARRRIIGELLARQGVCSGLVTPLPVADLARRHPGCADAVLLDVPCSGHALRSERQLARQAQRQQYLLDQAAGLCRPGGRLVYSTCTPYRAENEAVVLAFLAQHPEWTVERVAPLGCDPDFDDLGAARLWPHRQGSEPFFACRLRAPDAGPRSALAGRLPRSEAAVAELPIPSGLCAWQTGGLWLLATPAAAAAALPSEARGLVLARGAAAQPDPWGIQALIERGLPAQHLTHERACRLWAGEALSLDGHGPGPVATDLGAPLGRLIAAGEGRLRLALPSRLCRAGLE